MNKNQNLFDEQFYNETETVINMTKRNRKRNDIKEMKKQEKILKKKKRVKRIAKIFALLVLIIIGFVFALVSPIFNVQTIEVKGNELVAEETIVSLSQIGIGQNIFKFNKLKTINEIKSNPYIEDVKISRKIPNKIEITVTERTRDYNVEFLNGYAYINNQGYILEISEEKLDVPTIQGISTNEEQIVPGNRLDVEDLEKLEVVIQIINICKNYELEDKITSINVEDTNNYIVYMEQEKKEILLGDGSNLNNKMLYVPIILEENQNVEGIIYLNGDLNNGFKPRFKESV